MACAMFRLCHASYNFSGFEGTLSAPCVGVVNVAFFGFPELRFRWCLAFLHPLPTSFIQPVPCSGCVCSGCVMLHNFSSFEGALSAPCVGVVNVVFFRFPELRFRWCLAFLHPLPTSFIQLVPCSGCAMLHNSVCAMFRLCHAS